MADTKISALTAAASVAATNELAINEAGTSKKITAQQMKTFALPTLITGASGALSADAAPSVSLQRLTADNGDITGVALVDQLTATGCGNGWWLAEYFLNWESNVTTTGIAFRVTHSGTASPFVATREDMVSSATALATVGIAHQNRPTTPAGWLPSNFSARANATTLGPNEGVDTINVPILTRLTAQFLVTGTGSLVLSAAAQIAATVVRVNAGTMARYTRFS